MTTIPPPAVCKAAGLEHRPGRADYRPKGVLRLPQGPQIRGGIEGVMMDVSEKDQLMSLLFGDDTTLLNLKIFRGFPTHVGGASDEDVCREIRSAILQKKDGRALISKSFNDDAKKIDVRTLLRS